MRLEAAGSRRQADLPLDNCDWTIATGRARGAADLLCAFFRLFDSKAHLALDALLGCSRWDNDDGLERVDASAIVRRLHRCGGKKACEKKRRADMRRSR
jgi:hypothetical protein